MELGVRTSRTYPALLRSARRVQRSASALRRRSPHTQTIFVGGAGRSRRLITRPEPSLPDLATAARRLRQRQTRSGAGRLLPATAPCDAVRGALRRGAPRAGAETAGSTGRGRRSV